MMTPCTSLLDHYSTRHEPTLFDGRDKVFAESNPNMKQPAMVGTDGKSYVCASPHATV